VGGGVWGSVIPTNEKVRSNWWSEPLRQEICPINKRVGTTTWEEKSWVFSKEGKKRVVLLSPLWGEKKGGTELRWGGGSGSADRRSKRRHIRKDKLQEGESDSTWDPSESARKGSA